MAETDVIIVGSGVAAALLACELREAHVAVHILEAGGYYHRNEAIKRYRHAWNRNFQAPYPDWRWLQTPHADEAAHYYSDKGNMKYAPLFLKGVGGSTWLWTGMTPRFVPNDFRLRSLYGTGQDWPLSYDDLEPYYLQAEQRMGVAGDSDDDHGSPRSGDYPMPAIPMSYGEQWMATQLHGHGVRVASSPAARNSRYYQGRQACCGSNTCTPICPSSARYDAANDVARAIRLGAKLTDRATVYRLENDGEKIVAVHYKRPDGSSIRVAAKRVVLACNSVEIPRLLLMSANKDYPSGLANRSGQVGRNLMDHVFMLYHFTTPEAIYSGRGPQAISHILHGRDGAFRKQYAAAKVFIGNDPNVLQQSIELLKNSENWHNPVAVLRQRMKHTGMIGAELETLPHSGNRICLDFAKRDPLGLPLPRVDYQLSAYTLQAKKHWQDYMLQLITWMKGTNPVLTSSLSAHHMVGTTRMGKSADTSVVDMYGRSHDHPNLYISSSSVFPSIGTANPTLTIAALTLRLAKHLIHHV